MTELDKVLTPKDQDIVKAQTTESTRAQVNGGTFFTSIPANANSRFRYLLFSPLPASYDTYRRMRRSNPTIAMARDRIISEITVNEESLEYDDNVPEYMVEFIQSQWDKIKFQFKEQCLGTTIDFGWAAFEKCFEYKDGYIVINQMKHLLNDISALMIDIIDGSLWGIRQPVVNGFASLQGTGSPIEINLDYAAVFSWRVTGTQFHGESTLENLRQVWSEYNAANDGARRYDLMVAGSTFVVHYPDGSCIIDGVETSCAEAADNILQRLESSGSISIPAPVEAQIIGLNSVQPGWSVELLSDNTPRQPSFIERLRYFDTLFVRGFSLSERSMLEGQQGTKAEATTHSDNSLTILEARHRWMCNEVNSQIVNQLLRINFGVEWENTIRLVPAPLSDSALQYQRDLLKQALIANPQALDINAMLDELDIPKATQITGSVITDDVSTEQEVAQNGESNANGNELDYSVPQTNSIVTNVMPKL